MRWGKFRMHTDIITSQLEQDILSGHFAPGQSLSQSDLATRFDVSRIPVRDALARLAAQGLITLSPNRTARVITMTTDEIDEAYDLRILLECDLLKRAVPRMTARHLADIEYALARSDLEALHANWSQGDQMFHNALYAAADRARQQSIVDQLRRACRIQIAAHSRLTVNTPRWLAQHKALRDACHARDVDAAVTGLADHLRAARISLLLEMSQG